MLTRFFEFVDLRVFDLFERNINELVPVPADQSELRRVLDQFQNFEKITKKLQAARLPLSKARKMLLTILKHHPELTPHQVQDRPMKKSYDFEQAVSKVLEGKCKELTHDEKATLKDFELKPDFIAPSTSTLEEELSLIETSDQNTEETYLDLSIIPSTSSEIDVFLAKPDLPLV
ncbi:hypothetical protein RCL1_008940 [Eukaryota sp. TZLM3-RCL]